MAGPGMERASAISPPRTVLRDESAAWSTGQRACPSPGEAIRGAAGSVSIVLYLASWVAGPTTSSGLLSVGSGAGLQIARHHARQLTAAMPTSSLLRLLPAQRTIQKLFAWENAIYRILYVTLYI